MDLGARTENIGLSRNVDSLPWLSLAIFAIPYVTLFMCAVHLSLIMYKNRNALLPHINNWKSFYAHVRYLQIYFLNKRINNIVLSIRTLFRDGHVWVAMDGTHSYQHICLHDFIFRFELLLQSPGILRSIKTNYDNVWYMEVMEAIKISALSLISSDCEKCIGYYLLNHYILIDALKEEDKLTHGNIDLCVW